MLLMINIRTSGYINCLISQEGDRVAIKDKPIYVKIIIFLVGVVVVNIAVSIILVLLEREAGITIGGAIPTLLLYGLPIVILGSWLGIRKSKRSGLTTRNDPKPSDDK